MITMVSFFAILIFMGFSFICLPREQRLFAVGALVWGIMLVGSGLLQDLLNVVRVLLSDSDTNVSILTPKFFIVLTIGFIWARFIYYKINHLPKEHKEQNEEGHRDNGVEE